MARILLGVTGSVAAMRTPLLVGALAEAGHEVKVLATEPARYFFDAAELPSGVLHTEADEWPRRAAGTPFQREDPVLHIELRRWAELLLIAPLDANTLAKLALGLADNALTCVWRAWDPERPCLLAPAMNTLMWDHPLTRWHLWLLLEQFRLPSPRSELSPEELVALINEQSQRLRFVGPIAKHLACGDVGMGGMAEVADIVSDVTATLG